jgi:hypothetical protein
MGSPALAADHLADIRLPHVQLSLSNTPGKSAFVIAQEIPLIRLKIEPWIAYYFRENPLLRVFHCFYWTSLQEKSAAGGAMWK